MDNIMKDDKQGSSELRSRESGNPTTEESNGSPLSEHNLQDEAFLKDEDNVFSHGALMSSENLEEEDRAFCDRLQNDKTYRRKYFMTLNLIAAFFAFGWMAGQAGPSFLDLQIITNVSLDRGSVFFTASGVGYLSGSLITGYVFDRIKDKMIIVFFSVVGMGVTTAVIPFCYMYELMVSIQLGRGIAGGGLDTSGNTLLTSTWGNQGRMFMQALHFGFALGGTISPLALAPFLTPDRTDTHSRNLSEQKKNPNISVFNDKSVIRNDFLYEQDNSNLAHFDINDGESTLYIAYMFTALMFMFCSFPALIIFFQNRKRRRHEKEIRLPLPSDKEKKKVNPVEMTGKMKTMVIVNLMLMFMFSGATEESFTAFLSTFCVRHLKWTKVKGALITSVFWATFATGRLAGILLVVIFAPSTLIFLYALEVPSFFALFISVSFQFDVGMWIFCSILGFAMSVIFPCIFTWTEVSFMPITGRLASLFMVVTCTATSVNPIILGEIMDKWSDMWFIYLLTGEAVLFYIFFLTAFYISRKYLKTRPFPRDMTIKVKDDYL